MDVQACHIDCLSAAAHKWLLGPEGIAAFYCSEPLRSRLQLNQAGWHMFDYPWRFDRPDWTPSSNARRFEAGTPNTLGQVGMNASLSLILGTGLDKVSEAVLRNTRLLISGLSALPGVSISSATAPGRQSGIVSFRVVNNDEQDVYKRLNKAGVSSAFRNGSIRLSPHYYQSDDVMDKLLEKVEDAL
jgi:selenocysteine lyase/cysteine desulfurase